MDLKAYYNQIEALEEEIGTADVVIASKKTPDGGREGVFTEVSRGTAAKLIVEGKARLATKEESEAFRAAEQKRTAEAKEQLKTAAPVAVLTSEQLETLRRSIQRYGE
jgi:ribosomal protein L9